MRKLALLVVILVPLGLIGCKGSSEPSEAQLRQKLSGPPSPPQGRREQLAHAPKGKPGANTPPADGSAPAPAGN